MPLFIKSTLLAALLSIPVFGTAVIGANYPSPILHHLVDIVNGGNTQTIASLNAPNWSVGIPLASPAGIAAATSTGGTLASSTAFYFQVAALDGFGTTTVSETANATTQTGATNSIRVTWGTVSGATGYAIYFSTSTATNFTQYFFATSTNGIPNTAYTFATSTGSLAGMNTLTDSTAFATKINPLGASFLDGGGAQILGQTKIGTTTAASSTQLEVNGYLRTSLSATSTACYSETAGEVFYNTSNSHLWGCNGTSWIKILLKIMYA